MAVKSFFKNSVSVVALTTLITLGGASIIHSEAKAWFGSSNELHAEDIQPVSDVKIIDEVAPIEETLVQPAKTFIEETVKIDVPNVPVEAVAVEVGDVLDAQASQQIKDTTIIEDVIDAVADKGSDIVSDDTQDYVDLKSVPTPPALTSQERAAQLKKELLNDIAEAEQLKRDVLDVPSASSASAVSSVIEKVDVEVPSLPTVPVLKTQAEEVVLNTVKAESVPVVQAQPSFQQPTSSLSTVSKQEQAIAPVVNNVAVPRWTKTPTEERAVSLLSRLEKAKTEKQVLTPIGLSDVDRVMAMADAELRGDSFDSVVSNKVIDARDIYQVTNVKGGSASGIGISRQSNQMNADVENINSANIDSAVSNQFMDRANLMNTDLINTNDLVARTSTPVSSAVIPELAAAPVGMVSRSFVGQETAPALSELSPTIAPAIIPAMRADRSVLLSTDNLILLPDAEKMMAAKNHPVAPVINAVQVPVNQVSSAMLVDDEAMQKIDVMDAEIVAPEQALNVTARDLVYQQALMNATPEVRALGNVSRDLPSNMRALPPLSQALSISSAPQKDMVMVVEGRSNDVMTQSKPALMAKNNGVVTPVPATVMPIQTPLKPQMDSIAPRVAKVPEAAKRQAMPMLALPTMDTNYMGEVASIDAVQRVLNNAHNSAPQNVPQNVPESVQDFKPSVPDVMQPTMNVTDSRNEDLVAYRNINDFDAGQTEGTAATSMTAAPVAVTANVVSQQQVQPQQRQQKPIRIVVQPEYYYVPAPQQNNPTIQRQVLSQPSPVMRPNPQVAAPMAPVINRRPVMQQASAQFSNLPAYRRPVMYQRGNNISREGLRNSINKSAEALAKIDFKPSSAVVYETDQPAVPFSK